MSRLIIGDLHPSNPTLSSISASEADRIVGGWGSRFSSYNFGQTNSGFATRGTITVGQNVFGYASSPSGSSYSSGSLSGSATGQNVYMSSNVSGFVRGW